MKFKNYLFLLLIACLSCDNEPKSEDQSYSTAKLEKVAEQSFSVPPSSTNYTKYLQYYKNSDDEYLVSANHNNYTIELYSFSKERIVHKYKLPRDGKHDLRYPQVFGFYLVNFDSVFVNAYDRPLLLLLNEDSEIVNAKTMNIGTANSSMLPLTRRPTEYFNNKLLFGAHPSGQYNKQFWSNPLYFTYDISSNQLEKNVSSSFVVKEGNYGAFHIHHSYTVNHDENLMIHNITYDQNLYVRNLNNQKIVKKIEVPSKYFSEIPPWKEEDNNEVDGHQEFYIENNSFKSILWDPYRKVYYRFAERGVELQDLNGQFNTWHDKLISVIVLNTDFEIIGESDLEQSKYRISNVFVGERGLYISTSNEKNPDYNEDLMNFDVFEIVETN